MSTRPAVKEAADHVKRVPTRRGPSISRKHREWITGYLFLAPDTLGLLIFLGIPMIFASGLGFFAVNGFGNFTFIGLGNYQQMFSDPLFLTSLQVTAIYIIGLVPATFVVSLALALLVKQKLPFIGIFRSIFFMPYVVSLIVVAFVWKFMLIDQIGLVNRVFQAIGLDQHSWLGDPKLALGTILVMSVWFNMGFYMITFLAGLQDIPGEYYDAASIDGARGWTTFRYITWPLLKPTSFFVLLILTVTAVAGEQGFDLVYATTRGGPDNATALGIYYIYLQAFQYGNYGYAAAMASFLVLLLFIATVIMFALTRGGRFDFD